MVGGINCGILFHDQNAFLSEIAAAFVDRRNGSGVLFQLRGGMQENVVAVTNAAEIQNKLTVCFVAMQLPVGIGTQQSPFVPVKEHEANLMPLVFRHASGNFQKGHHTGGIVVGIVLVSWTKNHRQQKQTISPKLKVTVSLLRIISLLL